MAARSTARPYHPGVPSDDDPFELPIDGTLDLHTFRPEDVPELVPEWLLACRARGLLEVRVVHGKGTGALRRTVAGLLARSPLVASFRTADESAGGWGATLVTLRR
jgi:DNA-nicking Smr family endonuclease